MLELLEADSPITKDDLIKIEKKLNIILPLEMKELYLNFNGGQPIFPCVHDDKYIYPVNSFYSLQEIWENLDWFDDDSFPDGFKKGELLVFAYFPGNGQFALSLRNKDYGKIYFYILEETATIYGKWDSFREFLNSFIEDKEE